MNDNDVRNFRSWYLG